MTETLILIEREDGSRDYMPESQLVRTDGVVDNEHERTTWVEYRFPDSDRIVHRSVHVTLKEWPAGMTGSISSFG